MHRILNISIQNKIFEEVTIILKEPIKSQGKEFFSDYIIPYILHRLIDKNKDI